MTLPTTAVSERQPWGWFIVHGFKDVENRSWATTYRGPVLVHASATFIKRDVQADTLWAADVARRTGHALPDRLTLQMLKDLTGGIIGVVTIVDCVKDHPSPWAQPGCWHWVLAEARPLPFMRCRGRLGFFPVTYAEPAQAAGRSER